VNRRAGQCVYIWRLGTMKMQDTIKSKFPQNTTPQLHFRSSKNPKYLSKKTKCLPCNRLSSMVIVRYTIHPFPQSHSSSLTVLSRPKPLENRPHPRRAQHPLHNQNLHNPRTKTTRLPRHQPQRHGARDRGPQHRSQAGRSKYSNHYPPTPIH